MKTKKTVRDYLSYFFIIIFLGMLIGPLVRANFGEMILESEKRKAAEFPGLCLEDGTINMTFGTQFDSWINDNIGFRGKMMHDDECIQYYLFNRFTKESNLYVGASGDLIYASDRMLPDIQHKNLYDSDYILSYTNSLDKMGEYVEEHGGKLFYMQCWDKHSIYPESLPEGIIQYGKKSKTDCLEKAIGKNCNNVNLVEIKELLINSKGEYEVYSRWGDVVHWSERGAYIGYKALMETINKEFDSKYRVLEEDDYDISIEDMGSYFGSGAHNEDYLEHFVIKNQKAQVFNDKLTYCPQINTSWYYINEDANNTDRCLVIGDSYIHESILDDIAESFSETIFILANYVYDFKTIFDSYPADIVIISSAEREDRTGLIIEGAKNVNNVL